MSTGRTFSRARSRLLAAAAAFAVFVPAFVAGAGSAQAQSARPSSPASGTLFEQVADLDIAAVTSTTGTKLYLSVNASRVPSLPSIDSAGVTLETVTADEAHGWNFDIGASAFTTTSSGAATIATGSAFGAYGSLDLTLTPNGTAKKINVCNASNYTLQQPEKVTGSVSFDTLSTGSHSWGDVKATSFTFPAAFLYSTYTGGSCTPPPSTSKCSADIGWGAANSGFTIDFSGSNTGLNGKPEVFVTRVVDLSTPAHATRVDLVIASSPAPVLTTSGTAAKMKVTTSGSLVHGSGSLQSTAAGSSTTDKCTGGSGSETETTWTAAFTPGSPTLSATEQIEGTITLPSKVSGEIDRQTT
jgi:hypothetical protein